VSHWFRTFPIPGGFSTLPLRTPKHSGYAQDRAFVVSPSIPGTRRNRYDREARSGSAFSLLAVYALQGPRPCSSLRRSLSLTTYNDGYFLYTLLQIPLPKKPTPVKHAPVAHC
jgi:hypothetical protein